MESILAWRRSSESGARGGAVAVQANPMDIRHTKSIKILIFIEIIDF